MTPDALAIITAAVGNFETGIFENRQKVRSKRVSRGVHDGRPCGDGQGVSFRVLL